MDMDTKTRYKYEYKYKSNKNELFENCMWAEKINDIKHILNTNPKNSFDENIIFQIIKYPLSTKFKLQFLNLLYNHDFNFELLNQEYLNPLLYALLQCEYDVVEYLISINININYFGPENSIHPLTIAIHNQKFNLARMLLDHNIDCKQWDKKFCSPGHAIFKNYEDIPYDISRNIIIRSNINKTDIEGNTILIYLIKNNIWHKYYDVLIYKKMKIHVKNKYNESAFSLIQLTSKKNQKLFYNMIVKSYIGHNINQNINPKSNNMIKYILNEDKNKSKSKDNVKIWSGPNMKYQHFMSHTHNYICYLSYLLDKYRYIKIPILPHKYMDITHIFENNYESKKIYEILNIYYTHNPLLLNHIIIWSSMTDNFISPYLNQALQHTCNLHHNNDNLIIIKLTIIRKASSNHANMILIYPFKKRIERFDPLGYVPFYDTNSVDLFLKIYFSKVLPDFEYYDVKKLQNNISYQIYSNDPESKGQCLAWCLWYVETKILNLEINIDPIKFVNKTTDLIKKTHDFKNYIEQYAMYLDKHKNIIMNNYNIPDKYWYTNHMPQKIYDNYVRHINKKINELIH